MTPREDRNHKSHARLDHGTVSVTVERQGMREPTESSDVCGGDKEGENEKHGLEHDGIGGVSTGWMTPSKRIHPRFLPLYLFSVNTRNPVLTLLYVRSNPDMLLPIRGASNSEIGTSTSSFVRGFPHKPQPPTFPPLLTRHSPASLLSLARRTRPSTHPASPKIPPPAVPQFRYPRTPVGVCAVIVLHLLLDGARI